MTEYSASAPSVMLDLATSLGSLQNKIDTMLEEQQSAVATRKEMVQAIERVREAQIRMEPAVNVVADHEMRLRTLELARAETKGGVKTAGFLWGVVMALGGGAVSALVTKILMR